MTRPRVFLDTSALFAGIWSASGGGRMLLKLGEAGVIELVASSQVLHEIEIALRRKYPTGLAGLAFLLDNARVSVTTSQPPAELLERCSAVTPHPGDARIAADAWATGASFLATLDSEHFLENKLLRSAVPFHIGTPGDCLAWLRGKFGSDLLK